MPNLLDRAKIALLKRRARRAYRAYNKAAGSVSCGRALAEHVSGAVFEAKVEFNGVMDKLAKLDPDAPKQRL